jgi:membrane associated rhomboid family serine protease
MTLSVTLLIIIATVIVSAYGFQNESFKYKLCFSPYEVKHHRRYEQHFTHLFVHADWTHLIFNMLSLYFLGQYLEMNLIVEYGFLKGEIHFIILYFFGGFAASIWPMIRNHDNPNYLSLGASGAVSSVIFAMIIWEPKMELMFMFIPFPIPAYIFGPLYLAFEFWAFKRNRSNIAHDAHIGGAIFGIFYIFLINFDKVKQLSQLFN